MRTTGPGQPAHLLLDVLDLLTDLGIPYAVIGALAVSYYGIPRSTTDADVAIWLTGTGKSDRDLTKDLTAAGYRTELKRADIDDPIVGAIIAEDEHQDRVDLRLGVRGMDPEAVSRCVTASLLDSSVRIIAGEDLIAMKIFAGGFKDTEDVQGILEVSGHLLNLDLLRKLARRYGVHVAQTLEELLKEIPPTMH